jgi:hypothetical protein
VWQPNPDLDDSALLWRAVVLHGLTRPRSVLRPFGGGYGPTGLLGGMGAGTGGRLFTGPAADALGHAQQSAIRDNSPNQEAAGARLASWLKIGRSLLADGKIAGWVWRALVLG